MSFSEIITAQPESVCLLCGGPHGEAGCEDPRLRDFEMFCATNYHHMHEDDELDYFLCEFYTHGNYCFDIVLFCFAIKYARCNRNSSAYDCIENIVHYISDKYTLGHGTRTRTVWSYEGTHDPDNLWRMCEEYYLIMAENSTIFTDPYTDRRPNMRLWPFTREQIVPSHPRQQIDMVTELRYHSEEEYAALHDCGICWEKKEWREFVNYRCKHEFCKECVLGTLTHKQPDDPFTCALCRLPVDFMTFHSEETHDAFGAFLA